MLIVLAALLCRSAIGTASPEAECAAAAERHAAGISCGALLATEAPDRSVPEIRLGENGNSGAFVPSGKTRTLSSSSRRVQPIFRNIFLKGGETVNISGPEPRISSCAVPSLQNRGGHLRPIILRKLRI